jgi:hypothetical protein
MTAVCPAGDRHPLLGVAAEVAVAATLILLEGEAVGLERVPQILKARCGRPSWCSIVMI